MLVSLGKQFADSHSQIFVRILVFGLPALLGYYYYISLMFKVQVWRSLWSRVCKTSCLFARDGVANFMQLEETFLL